MDIKLSKYDKRYIEDTQDVFAIMQRILRRENKIDREKEHFWMIGMNTAGYILYIELIALGTVNSVSIEPMNVYRVAVMKNATKVIAIHNHPTGRLVPSVGDIDTTDRLIQVGQILNIKLLDHFIISLHSYQTFSALGLMDELSKSLKYVPTYQAVERVRKEEKAIAREAVKAAKDIAKAAKNETQKERQQKELLVMALWKQDMPIEQIAALIDVTPRMIERIINKKQGN